MSEQVVEEKVILISDETFDTFIASNDTIIIVASSNTCGLCDDYFPTFQKHAENYPEIKFAQIKTAEKAPSKFRRTYMVAQRIGEQIGTPTTFLFKKGKMVRKFFGFLPELSFQDFLNGTLDKTPAPAQKFDQNKPLDLTKQSLTELKAIAYDARELKEKIERDIQIINQEIQSRVK